jgi:hypothetical protein
VFQVEELVVPLAAGKLGPGIHAPVDERQEIGWCEALGNVRHAQVGEDMTAVLVPVRRLEAAITHAAIDHGPDGVTPGTTLAYGLLKARSEYGD